MDELLAKLGAQAFNMAIRSGIAITSTYAAQQCTRLLKTVDDKGVYAELKVLQKLLSTKIKIISPAIDLIHFKSGRGNVFLESAVPLAKSLHRDMIRLGNRLEKAAAGEELSRLGHSAVPGLRHDELLQIMQDIKDLLSRIDRDVPSIHLAISGSGECLSSGMPPGVSPSRLVQASTLLTIGDTQFVGDPSRPVQMGPPFTLSLYMLFRGHSGQTKRGGKTRAVKDSPNVPEHEEPYGIGEGERRPLWQEVIHKARVRLCRTPCHWEFHDKTGFGPKSHAQPASEWSLDTYSYELEIVEDLDDGRAHDEDDELKLSGSFDNIPSAGIRDSIPIHQISKIFYTDTGKILNIGNAAEGDNNPVLLLKRDASAPSPTKLREAWLDVDDAIEADFQGGAHESMAEPDEQADVDRQLREDTEPPAGNQPTPANKTWRLPQHLDPEWLALEVFIEDEDANSDDSSTDSKSTLDDGAGELPLAVQKTRTPRSGGARSSVDSQLLAQIRRISLQASPSREDELATSQQSVDEASSFVARSPFGAITSSLSLLEMLVRLASLQIFQQTPHLAIPDHIFTFFLEETSTTGLRGEEKWKARNQAKRTVGFDPYQDTP